MPLRGRCASRRGLRVGARLLSAAIVAMLLVSAQPLRANPASERLDKIRTEIEAREARARRFADQAKGILQELEAIDRQVVEVRRSQRRLKERQRQAEKELDEARDRLAASDERLSQLRSRLERRLVVLYKSRLARGVPVIYSARDFQEGLRLTSHLRRILDADADLFDRYRQAYAQSEARAAEARSLVVELEGTEAEYLKRKQLENKQLVERKNLVGLLRTRATRERRAAGELREAAQRLERELGSRQPPVPVPGRGLVAGRVPRPLAGRVRLGFGERVDPEFNTVTERTGIEIEAPMGTPVRAIAAGRVLFARWFPGYGQMVIIDHGRGSLSISGFLEELRVEPDASVEARQVIGTVGETGSLTGPGLYFEIRKDGKAVDPERWFE